MIYLAYIRESSWLVPASAEASNPAEAQERMLAGRAEYGDRLPADDTGQIIGLREGHRGKQKKS